MTSVRAIPAPKRLTTIAQPRVQIDDVHQPATYQRVVVHDIDPYGHALPQKPNTSNAIPRGPPHPHVAGTVLHRTMAWLDVYRQW